MTIDNAGNTLGTARKISLTSATQTFSDFVGASDTNDFYSFSLGGRSSITLNLGGLSANADVQIVQDKNLNGVIDNTSEMITGAYLTGTSAESIITTLDPGNYFIRIYPGTGANTNYSLGVSAMPVPPDLAGNTLATARQITVGSTTTSFADWVGTADTNDYYRFTLNQNSNLNLSVAGLSGNADLQLLDANGATIVSSLNTGTLNEAISSQLNAGTYFVRIFSATGANTNYNFGVSAMPIPPDFAGNTLATARQITVGSTTTALVDWVGTPDTNDYYRFTLNQNSDFNLSVSGLSSNADVQLLDASGTIITSSLNTGTSSEAITRQLSAGTYFVRVFPGIGGNTFYNIGITATPNVPKSNHLGLVTDFNKDGKTDILWQNLSNGEFGAWAMNGTAGNWIDIEDGNDKNDRAWHFVGTGDFNNDGNTDIIQRYHWNNSPGYIRIWLMNGNQRIGTVEVEAVDNNDWHIVGTGDFNQDGNVDILWRNYTNGSNGVWMMRGNSVISKVDIASMGDLNQRIAGTGDFNNDGKSDILWRNAATGENSVWLMNGINRTLTANLDKVADLNWHIMGAADFNNDGKSDIIWRNFADGQNLVWLMDNSKYIGTLDIQDTVDRNWTMVGKTDPVGVWTAQYFGNKDLSGTPTHTEGFTDVTGNFSRNWGNGAPTNTPTDNFSARYKSERYLAAGLYKINLNSDDGVRVWLGNELVIDQWTDQAGSYSDYFTSAGGYYPVTVEYKENFGSAGLNYEIFKHQPYNNFGNPDGIVNSWNATFYHWNGQGNPNINDAHKIGTVNLGSNTRGDGQWGMNLQNWGSGSPARDVPTDFFAMHAYTRRNLTAGNTYEVWLRADDGFKIYAHKLNGNHFDITPNAVSGQWMPGAYGDYAKYKFVAPESGTFDFHVSMFEGGGNAYIDLILKDLTPQNRLQNLANKSGVLTIDEINEYRQLVSQSPEGERAQWYTTLQYKTPYFNQRDNGYTGIADIMCNVTTLASCLTFIGVKNPDQGRQFEDVLEDRLRSNPGRYPSSGGYNAREIWSNLSKLAEDFGVQSSGVKFLQGFNASDVNFFKNFARDNWESALRRGQAVMAGVWTTSGGHIVKVVDVDWQRGGLVIDDPFGKAQDSAGDDYKKYNYSRSENTRNRGSINTQQGQDEAGNGNDNFWSWSYCAEVFGASAYLVLGKADTATQIYNGSSADFGKALSFTLKWEGGYVNDPRDPGGATNKGITQRTYTSYRANLGLGFKDVISITDGEVNEIYRQNYWYAAGCDKLSEKLAMCHFDASVNHGIGKSPDFLAIARRGGGSEMDQAHIPHPNCHNR